MYAIIVTIESHVYDRGPLFAVVLLARPGAKAVAAPSWLPMNRNGGTGRMMRAASDSGPLKVQPLKLGERIREIRRRNSWTLEDASRRTGLARSTLSKIENEQMSPTFEVVQKLAAGLEIELPQLFEAAEPSGATGRRTITREGEGRPRVTATYEHELLSVELAKRKMIPFRTRVRARSFDAFSSWVRHPGEEFLYVLEGSIAFYTEFYEPVVLGAGDSVYYDSDMGHACVSVSDEDALILWVSTG